MVEKKPKRKGNYKPAPLGNQYAKGHGCGRPPKYDLVKEAEDLLEWSTFDSSLRLYGFTDKKDYCVSDLCEFAKKEPLFSVALKKAKERLANRREEHCNDDMLCKAVYDKTNHIYDHEVRDSDEYTKDRDLERRIKLIEYELKRKSEMEHSKGVPPNDDLLSKLISEIKTLKDKVNAS